MLGWMLFCLSVNNIKAPKELKAVMPTRKSHRPLLIYQLLREGLLHLLCQLFHANTLKFVYKQSLDVRLVFCNLMLFVVESL